MAVLSEHTCVVQLQASQYVAESEAMLQSIGHDAQTGTACDVLDKKLPDLLSLTPTTGTLLAKHTLG